MGTKNQDFWINVALNAQMLAIQAHLLEHYVGGRIKIGEWGDFKHSHSHFRHGDCVLSGLSALQIRRGIGKLAEAGIIVNYQHRACDVLLYRFPRQVCDLFAESATRYFQRAGYSLTEMLPDQGLRLPVDFAVIRATDTLSFATSQITDEACESRR